MKRILKSCRRFLSVSTSATVVLMLLASFASPMTAHAAQISTRSIQMSSALPGDTAVSYTVTFTPGTTGTIAGMAVDFCSDSPLIGSTTCAYPAGFTLGSATPTVASYSGMGTGWTTSGIQGGAGSGSYQTLKLSNTSAQSVSSGTPVSFVISGITNPTTANTSFYARISTYSTTANLATYTVSGTSRAASPTDVDYGGDAMSTNEAISISATVQEQLTFCVSGVLLSGSTTCAGATAANIVLGSGSPSVLNTSTPSTGTAATQISTNAGHGVVVRMINNNTCGGLERAGDGATCYIAPAGATAYTFAANSAYFGLNVGTSSTGTGGSGSTTAPAAYGTTGQYAMDATTSSNNVVAAPGSQIESVTGGCSLVNTPLTFAAEAANSTPAGVYTGTMNLIATGTF